ncbi:hypothetical protein ABTA37_18615, partial [Acinetobacter baumannii]
MVKQKNIIIGSATGYNADLISSFVYSLGKTDFDGILTLIIYKEQMTEFVNAFSDVKNFKIEFKVSTIGKFKSKSKYSGISLYTTNFTEPLSYQDSAFLKLPKFP